MRLVFVTHNYPRRPGDLAGSFLGHLTEALAARGHTVAVVTPSDAGRADRYTLHGAEVVPVRYGSPVRENLAYTGNMLREARTPGGALAFRRLVRGLRRQAREEARRLDADLVHAFWWVPGGWAAVGTGYPTVVSLMGTDVALLRSWPARLVARSIVGRVSRLTAISSFLADEVRGALRQPDLPIDRVPMPADTSRFTTRSEGGGGIVYLGRLTRQKRVHLLLEAVKAAGTAVPVHIIGDGAERAALEARARDLGLGHVRFHGYLDDASALSVLRDADVAAFPSDREGLGLAAAEMLMLGIPVVATTDGGGVLDLVRDGDGARVVPPEATSFGAALAECLGRVDLRAAAAARGDLLRERLAPAGVATAFESVYDRVQ